MIAPWYVMQYVRLERIAWRHGYALALHGSISRDMDLVAIPWTDDADAPEKLLKAFCRYVASRTQVNIKIGSGTKKPHGRMSYVIPIGMEGQYLDVAIMPRVERRKRRQA